MSTDEIYGICWPDRDFSMREFVDMFQYNLPVAVMTTTGIAGCDQDMHEIGGSEVCGKNIAALFFFATTIIIIIEHRLQQVLYFITASL